MCRDDQGRIKFQSGKFVSDCATLLAETITIREVVKESIQAKLSNVIIESDFQVAIRATIDDIKPQSVIWNIVADICILASAIRYIVFFVVIEKLTL